MAKIQWSDVGQTGTRRILWTPSDHIAWDPACCKSNPCVNCDASSGEIITAHLDITVPRCATSFPGCGEFPLCSNCARDINISWPQGGECFNARKRTGVPYQDEPDPEPKSYTCPENFDWDWWTVTILPQVGGGSHLRVDYRVSPGSVNNYSWFHGTACSGAPANRILLPFPIDCTQTYRLYLDDNPNDPGADFCLWYDTAGSCDNAFIDLSFTTHPP